jgi:hypothetical protein
MIAFSRVVYVRVVVVYFLWFYFHRKGIMNPNHNYAQLQQPYAESPWSTTLGVVVHAHVASLETFRSGEQVEE